MCLHGPAFVNYRRRAGDLPVLVHVVSQRARVLRPRRTGQPLASNAAAVLPSSYSSGSWHPDLAFFESKSPRPPMPRSTLRNTPRDVPRKTRGQDGVAFSVPVGLLHPLQHAGLTRRTTGNARSVEVGSPNSPEVGLGETWVTELCLRSDLPEEHFRGGCRRTGGSVSRRRQRLVSATASVMGELGARDRHSRTCAPRENQRKTVLA